MDVEYVKTYFEISRSSAKSGKASPSKALPLFRSLSCAIQYAGSNNQIGFIRLRWKTDSGF